MEQECGKCEICGKETVLERTYFYYPLKCECHYPQHFEMVRHCKNCPASMPNSIHPTFRAMDGNNYKAAIYNILPIKITGKFIIDKPIIEQ